ncbi:transcription termination factor 1, mitochondrial [Xiphias gladius]|uniref:transcription termination factor 1, mitochondrial n=1 Tax=Xiphias gladius TaxID=8245 RepID=UPI001A989C06|nr:transcription termination factor 1, mitochondrial [Xiphias gladius]XP_039977830.1 transcription termination factor 1, mitochondrial [Xiphias gladius]XP_039977831.1 transcription termination factor 1, mitochondrial [Xiphias gladius]XP_039977832.1 transcription termination factor 1, mitochondrial [Xiphias gladius]XP_039977833.1 transcription termination factor 1, mitochondrial [Xiphias gladius]
MAAVPGVRAFLSLRRSGTLQHSFGLIKVQLRSTCLPRRLCSAPTKSNEPKLPVNPENESLLENLNLMGVDVKMARQRQPGVLRKAFTNEQGLAQFLQGKGASRKVIASIISRYPRAITRSIEHLEQRWELWRNIFKTDAEIVTILDRSPESFFRSSDNGNLEKNIAFLTSLGLNTKDLHRLLTTAPRTFSNSLELNRQMVEFLEDICAELGGKNPEQFVKVVISRNLYILIRSTKRVKTNIDNLRASLKLSDSELLALLQGPGAEILDLSNEYLKKNFNSLQQKMASLGCRKVDIKKLIISYPMVLYIGPDTLSCKLDCLLKGGITMKQILEKPKVLDYSTQNITGRLEELQRVGYDFQKNGINILDSSRKRFVAKIEKLAATPDD